MSKNVWLITGSSAGLGREIVVAAAKRGDLVVATARRLESIKDLESENVKLLQLDITDPSDVLKSKAKEADALFGRPVNVLMNNAGYGAWGIIEESSPDDLQKQFDANFFGPIELTKAFLPSFRAQGSDAWLLYMSSVGAWVSFGTTSVYQASKHALRAVCNGLAAELEPFGTHLVAFEPGVVKTRFFEQESVSKPFGIAPPGDPYQQIKAHPFDISGALAAGEYSDADKCAERVVDVVHASGLAAGKKVPREIVLGNDARTWLGALFEQKSKDLEDWKELSDSTMAKAK